MSDRMSNKEYANGLREIADFFEAHPEVSIPHDASQFSYFSANTKTQMAALVRAFGGRCEKQYDKDFTGAFTLVHRFGGIEFRAIANRSEVCERVVIGKRPVPETIIPAQEAKVIPAHDEEIVVWNCPESLLSEEPIDIDSPLGQAIRHEQATAEACNDVVAVAQEQEEPRVD